jgi:hypothetical protein
MMKEIIKRYKNNTILIKDDVSYPVQTVLNAGVTKSSKMGFSPYGPTAAAGSLQQSV